MPLPRAVSVTNNSSKKQFYLGIQTKHEGLNVADNGIQ
jgi:hypothetical protein